MLINSDFSKNIIKIETTTITEKIVAQIKSMIEQEIFLPGDSLPTEKDFAQMLGVGRSSIREALRALQAIGIIENTHGNTARFSQTCATFAAEYFNIPNILNNFTLMDLSEARETIEVSLASLAAANASDEQIAGIDTVLKKFESAIKNKNYDEILDLDFEFHKAIADSSGNLFLAQMLLMLHDLIIAGNEQTLTQKNVASAGKFHREIYSAIKERDIEGVKASMKLHMEDIKDKFSFKEGE